MRGRWAQGMVASNKESGVRQRRRQGFFKEHPFCCFCGGVARATTKDHVPNRALFPNGQVPDRYLFPACQPCNDSTNLAESRFTLSSQLHAALNQSHDWRKIEQRLYYATLKDPTFVAELLPTARQLRSAEKSGMVQRDAGQFLHELPIMNAGGPLIHNAVTVFGVKLFCALYYKETGDIVPKQGGIAVSWHTNFNRMQGDFPESVIHTILKYSNAPTLRHGKLSITNVFDYRIATTEEKSAVIAVSFGFGLFLFGFVYRDRNSAPKIENCIYYPPAFHRLDATDNQT